MSGQNKKASNKNWRFIFYLLGAIYVIVVISLAVIIYNVPQLYAKYDEQKIIGIKTDVDNALTLPNDEAITTALNDIVAHTNMELVVKQGDTLLESTMTTTDFNQLQGSIDSQALNYESAYQITANGKTYQVWIAIYQFGPQQFFEFIMWLVTGSIILLCIIISILIFVLFRKLISPLRRLQQNISNLREFHFDGLEKNDGNTEYDALSEQLEEFGEELQDRIETIDQNYTRLEIELQKRQERNEFQNKLASALVHDLKTPINLTMIYAERLQEHYTITPNADDLFNKIAANDGRILNQINETIQVVNAKDLDISDAQEIVDVVPLIRETLNLFQPFFAKREIEVIFESAASIMVTVVPIEFKQIVHNIISNASQYADSNGLFRFIVEAEAGLLKLNAYNVKQDISQINFSRVFDLFYRAIDENKNDYGSGVGMYTIKSMVEELHGNCRFEPIDDGVQLVVELPIVNEVSNDEA